MQGAVLPVSKIWNGVIELLHNLSDIPRRLPQVAVLDLFSIPLDQVFVGLVELDGRNQFRAKMSTEEGKKGNLRDNAFRALFAGGSII